MVRHEIKPAYDEKKPIFPVRVNCDGALPYDLGAYLNPMQYKLWRTDDSFELTVVRLRDREVACAIVDLHGKSDASSPKDQWHYGVVKQVAPGLGLEFGAWWKRQEQLLPAQRMTDFLAEVD